LEKKETRLFIYGSYAFASDHVVFSVAVNKSEVIDKGNVKKFRQHEIINHEKEKESFSSMIELS
jgi:hypothetical protein